MPPSARCWSASTCEPYGDGSTITSSLPRDSDEVAGLRLAVIDVERGRALGHEPDRALVPPRPREQRARRRRRRTRSATTRAARAPAFRRRRRARRRAGSPSSASPSRDSSPCAHRLSSGDASPSATASSVSTFGSHGRRLDLGVLAGVARDRPATARRRGGAAPPTSHASTPAISMPARARDPRGERVVAPPRAGRTASPRASRRRRGRRRSTARPPCPCPTARRRRAATARRRPRRPRRPARPRSASPRRGSRPGSSCPALRAR